MQEAGHHVINCHRILAKTNDNIVGELLRDTKNSSSGITIPMAMCMISRTMVSITITPSKEERQANTAISIHFAPGWNAAGRDAGGLGGFAMRKIPMTHSVT